MNQTVSRRNYPAWAALLALRDVALLMIPLLLGVGILHAHLAQSDEMYCEFLGESRSLVVGSSRALIAIDPATLGAATGQKVVNFAFTRSNSPCGRKYAEAVRDKLEIVGEGFVVLEVSPLAFCTPTDNASDDPNQYSENAGFLNTRVTQRPPNLEYMVKHARRPLYLNLLGNPTPDPDAVRLGWRVFSPGTRPARPSRDPPAFTKRTSFRDASFPLSVSRSSSGFSKRFLPQKRFSSSACPSPDQ